MSAVPTKAKKPTAKDADWQYFNEVKRILVSSKDDLPRLRAITDISPTLVATEDSHYLYQYIALFWEMLGRSPEDQKRTKHPVVIKEVSKCVEDYFSGTEHKQTAVVPVFAGAGSTKPKGIEDGFYGPEHLNTRFNLEAVYARGSGKDREIKISLSTVAGRVTLKQAKTMAGEWLKLNLPPEIRSEHRFKGFSGTCQALNKHNKLIKTYAFEPLTQIT